MEVQLRQLGPSSKINVLKVPRDCRTKIWLVGRGTSCQIYTKSRFASRQHFCITYKDHKYFISDLQSINGTFVNDERLSGEKALTFGCVISVGVPSEMQNLKDCIVYVFESHVDEPAEQPSSTSHAEGSSGAGPPEQTKAPSDPPRSPENGDTMDVEVMEVDADGAPAAESGAPPEGNLDEERTVLNDSDVILIESPEEGEGEGGGSGGLKPAKRRRVEKAEGREEGRGVWEEVVLDDEQMAYEALTQVDEVEVKVEPELLNYSQTEELIEISDSEEDWSGGLKEEGKRSGEEAEEDDEVVLLETVVKAKEARKFDAAPVGYSVQEDLTEVDRKWLERLLRMKKEEEVRGGEEAGEEGGSGGRAEGGAVEVVDIVEESEEEGMEEVSRDGGDSVGSCTAGLSRLSTAETVEESPTGEAFAAAEAAEAAEEESPTGEAFTGAEAVEEESPAGEAFEGAESAEAAEEESPAGEAFAEAEAAEAAEAAVEVAEGRKCVSFNLIPEVRYFEVQPRLRLSAAERGRLRFSRVIYNLCNWNTHWLEECKRVAPEKNPPDICEEPLRKIPKKFLSHSEYMGAFVPATLVHLWNKIKEKWVASGESGFRQTVSCDSCEEYQGENLWVYRCTGLVQNVEAHRELLREGHMVLLRLHQSQSPEFSTPASEKYSKKLGYLVFGFVEGRSYEPYGSQPLHPALEERCASILGNLHMVRLSILVKKRPNFQMDKRKLIQLTVVHWISQELRMFRGICFLPNSPLCTAILRPTDVEFSLPELPREEKLVFEGPLDDFQREVIRKLSYACASTDSFMYSVCGAAGTGKGQVVIGLILQLLRGEEWNGKRPKVVYCTQWSVPLDETVGRLRAWSQRLAEPISLVRVGPVREVKPEVRDLCLTHLAAGLQASYAAGFAAEALSYRAGRIFDAEIELLKKADVICSTCLTTGVAKMSSAFEKLLLRDPSRKVICIIDEAMSCPEKDSIIPLLLGVTHLILVGDICRVEQCFSGEKAHSLGLDVSLIWRIHKNFANHPKEKRPLVVLKTQYRMNPSLAKFTSLLIYNTALQKPFLSLCNWIPNIRTHLLLVEQMVEGVAGGGRGKLVSQLVRATVKLLKECGKSGLSVGAISCDAKEAERVQGLLPSREFPGVVVGQLQAFQGREFDVVVFSYDGRKMLTSRLNTALTRARCSLLVVASQESLGENATMLKLAEAAQKQGFKKYVYAEMGVEDLARIIGV